jgi:hypothetical protein
LSQIFFTDARTFIKSVLSLGPNFAAAGIVILSEAKDLLLIHLYR